MKDIRIAIFGNKSTTSRLIRHLYFNGFKIDTLVTIDPKRINSLNISGADTKISELAMEYGFALHHPKKYSMNDECDIKFFEKKRFDIGICTGWQRLIGESILDTFTQGVYGWHGSGFEFPNGRGRSPLNWSMRLGCKIIHHNCFKYNVGADEGHIYNTKDFAIEENDYISDIIEKAFEHIKNSSISLIQDAKRGKILLREQADHASVLFPKLCEKDGLIRPEIHSVESAINITKSCSRPFPGAYLSSNTEKFRIWKLEKNREDNINYESKRWVVKGNKLYITFNNGNAVSNDFEAII